MYRELYYRHVYSRLQPDIDDRFSSYENYCSFFNYILNSETPVPLELPVGWLWDIIDEFIYQFSTYTTWKGRVGKKTDEEVQMIAENPQVRRRTRYPAHMSLVPNFGVTHLAHAVAQVWSCYSVLNVLYSLITKSKIQEQLQAIKRGEDPESVTFSLPASSRHILLISCNWWADREVGGEWGSKPLYRMLGYFSIIGLLRVHVLLGDYTLALKMMDDIELNKKAWFTRVNAAHVTVYYCRSQHITFDHPDEAS